MKEDHFVRTMEEGNF